MQSRILVIFNLYAASFNIYIISLLMRKNILLLISIILLANYLYAQDTEPTLTPLNLGTMLTVSDAQPGYTYYAVNFVLKSDSPSLFLVTVQTQQQNSISIFTSIYYDGIDNYFKYPNYQNNTHSCSYSTIDTCALTLPKLKDNETKQVTVYIGVQVFFNDKLTIMTSLQQLYPGKVGLKYDINFKVSQSGILTLSAQQINQYEQVVINMQYNSWNTAGKFALYAGLNKIPNSWEDRLQSKYMGAFTQILILNPIQDGDLYYIIVEGQLGTQFDLYIKPFSTSSPKLVMNQTVFYYSNTAGSDDGTNFQLALNYKEQEEVLPLFLDLNSLAGYGEFQIDYCNGLTNFTFINMNGESGEVIIPVAERNQCYQILSTEGGLLIENIIVTVSNVRWYFAYSIGLFEGRYPLIIGPYSEKLGTLLKEQEVRVHSIQSYINQSFILKYKTITGEPQLNFTLFQCKSALLNFQKCTKLLNSNENSIIDDISPDYFTFNFTCVQKRHYKLQVGHNTLQKFDSQYILLLLPLNQKPMQLSPSNPIISIINQNQYQYYIVNLSLIQKQSNIVIDNTTNIMITMFETNGNCLLLTSLIEKRPLYDQIFQQNSTVDFSWSGKKQFNLDSNTEAIYIGILGSTQSMYHLQVTIQVNQDIPEKYTKLVSDKLLSYSLSSTQKQDHILLSYTAHSIPYMVIISPTPSCVIYSYTLPITQKKCRELPNEITEKVIYMKVYRNFSDELPTDDKDFKFTVYVYSGSHYLFKYNPVLVACQDTCYEFVTVYVPQKIKIVHKGMGFIGHKDTNQSFSNQKVQLTCEKNYPCFLTIKASLPYGGDMQLFYDSADIQEIEWVTKPLTFQSIYDPKYFYMQIRSWNSLNTAIFYAEGVSMTIYYNIYSMRQNATNALEYGLPNSFFYMKKSEGNPLRRFHIVEFDQQLIEKLGCKDDNDICIATLAVYPNNNVEYSSGYIKNSIGYYSSNTFRYYVPMNSPYQLSQEYSLIYFSHQLSEDQANNMPDYYYVKVQPLSSCRPQIFAPFSSSSNNGSYNLNMPFYGNYKIDSKTIDKTKNIAEFTISTDTPCEYMLWLLDSDIQPVMSNVNYQIQSDDNGFIYVVFSDKYMWSDKKFSVNFNQQMSEIIIDKYQKYPNGSIKYPSANSYLAYTTQSKQLSYAAVDQFISTLYIIKASTNVKSKVNLKISTNQFQAVLLTNEQTKFSFSQESTSVSFLYYSNNDFLMFVTTDAGTVKLSVTDYKRDQDKNVIDMYINDQSDPWISVKAVKGDIRQYVITLENVLLANNNVRNLQKTTQYPKINLHIEQTGTIGLPQLYDGVALFDAFYQEDSQNCYKYQSEAIVGRPGLTVDLIFGSEFINKLPKISSRLSISDGGKIISNWTKLPTGYRLSAEYYGNEEYEFCFSINDQPDLVSKQFYLMIQNIEYSLKHLTLDVPHSSNNPNLYQIYQYVATQNQNLMIQVVNCFGKPTLLGAKQYSDIYLGQVSQLGPFFRDQTKSIASKNLQLGYFFFGIKLNDYNDRYKIRVQLLQQNQKIHYDRFQLKAALITKAKTIDQNGKKAVRVNLPRISFLNLPKEVKVHHINYNLFVDNLKQQQQYSSNVIAKCPVLANRNMSSYKFTQSYAQSVKAQGTPSDEVTIDVPIGEVPESFNLTGYVEVSISEPYTQTLTYYYESTSFKLKNTNEGSGMSIFTILFIIVLIIGSLLIVFIIYRRWKERKEKAKIAFQMATYNHQNYDQNSNPSNHNQKVIQNVSTVSTPQKSLKKALNQNTGYGQFVDESM